MVWALIYFFAFAFLLSLALVWCARKASPYLNIMDYPLGNKPHSRAMPLFGGAGIFGAFALTIIIHYLLHCYLTTHPDTVEYLPTMVKFLMNVNPEGWWKLTVITVGGLLIFAVGLMDDYTFFHIKWRLLAEFAIAGGVVALGIQPEFFGVTPMLLWPLTMFWIVAVTNAFNLIDGMDGMASGLAIIAAFLMALYCSFTDQNMVAILLLIFCGSAAGFLRYNWHPASIFMGSSGSLFLGYTLATVPLVAAFMQVNSNIGAMLMPVLILSVPIYDTVSVVVIRLWNHRSPFSPDHNHIFHRLHRLGLSIRQTVLVVYLLAIAVGLGALLLMRAQVWEAVTILIHVLAMYGVFVVIEMASVRLRDRQQVVDIKTSCRLFDSPPGDAVPGRVRLLTGNSAEVELPGTAGIWLSMALVENVSVALELVAEGKENATLVIRCHPRSMWRVDGGRIFVGLAFRFDNDMEYRKTKAFVAEILYPARKQPE